MIDHMKITENFRAYFLIKKSQDDTHEFFKKIILISAIDDISYR